MAIKKVFMALRLNAAQCFSSAPFWLSSLAFAVVLLLGVWKEWRPGYDVLYLHNLQEFEVIMVFIAALSYSASFCIDWRYHFSPYAIQRSSIAAYAWAKYITSALGGALSVLLGKTLYFGVLMVTSPLIEQGSSVLEAYACVPPFGYLLYGNAPMLFFALMVLLTSIEASMYASIAMAVSAFIPNLFVALSSPIFLYYLSINWISRSRYRINPLYIYSNISVDMGGFIPSLLYAAGYAFVVCLLGGLLFCWGVKRRVVHG